MQNSLSTTQLCNLGPVEGQPWRCLTNFLSDGMAARASMTASAGTTPASTCHISPLPLTNKCSSRAALVANMPVLQNSTLRGEERRPGGWWVRWAAAWGCSRVAACCIMH